MNNIVEVDCRLVTLSGVILSSSLTLHNPHELLAVMFEVTPSRISWKAFLIFCRSSLTEG